LLSVSEILVISTKKKKSWKKRTNMEEQQNIQRERNQADMLEIPVTR
jgi:hypothetical protein